MENVNESSRTEFDSHANMPVIGMNAYILLTICETVDVARFTQITSLSLWNCWMQH